MLNFLCSLVVIAVDEMDCLASQPMTIRRRTIRLAETEVSEEVKRVVGLHIGVQSIHNHLIHLPRICERAIAISNDVEVSKMKVGRKPSVSHDDDYAGTGSPHCLYRQPGFRVSGECFGAHDCRVHGAWAVVLVVAFEWTSGMYLHAERLLAKVGGSNCKPRGIPTLATGAQRKWNGRSAAEVCTSEARKIGEWLAGARGYLPLEALALALALVGRASRGGRTAPHFHINAGQFMRDDSSLLMDEKRVCNPEPGSEVSI